MKLYVPSAYCIGVVLILLLNPPTNTATVAAAAAITAEKNIDGKDNINEKYNLRHPSPHDAHHRNFQEVAVVPPGIWTSYGYGMVINSTGTVTGGVDGYDETNISCIPMKRFVYEIESWKWIDDKNSTIEIDGYIFNLTKTFQSGCSKGITPTAKDKELYVRDALYDYDVMVEWFRQVYPSFEIKNIDWNQMTQEARLLLRSDSNDTELGDTMEKLLMRLQDPMVAIWNIDFDFYFKEWELDNIMGKEANDIGESDVYLYKNQELLYFMDKISSYMEDSKLFNVTNATCYSCDGSNSWSYGQIKGTQIGYMLILNSYFDPDTAPITEDLDRVFQTFQNMSSMIIDIRINNGGYDSFALLLASYFSSERQLAWTTRTRRYQVDNGFIDGVSYYLNPSSLYFTGPVVVMMSESTVGTGEVFLLATSLLSQVTFLGKQTPGALSTDSFAKVLPNGWFLSLPDEAMISPDGTVYEGRGLSPDIIPDNDFITIEERHSSTDTWLEMAIKYLNNSNVNSNNNTTIPEATTSSSSEGTNTSDSSSHCMTFVIIMLVTLTYWNLE